MANYREDAEEAARAVCRMEPQAVVAVKKRFLRRSWYVEVVRNGERREYEDINQYWLESCLLVAFGGGREGNGEL